MTDPGQRLVPRPFAVAAAWSWRLLVVGAVFYVVLHVLLQLYVVVVPAILAAFFAAALEPLARWLRRRGWPRALAAAAVLVGGLAAVGVLVWWFSSTLASQFTEIGEQAQDAISQVEQWLNDGPLGLTAPRIDELEQQVMNSFGGSGPVLERALGTARTAAELLGAVVLLVFVLFFLLMDGDRIADWFLDRTPRRYTDDVAVVGRRVRAVLQHFLVGTAAVGIFNGVFIGLGLWLLDVPLALPLAVLTAVSAFFPLVGAFVAGGLSALVALATQGLTTALLVIGLTVLVQQIEGNVLQPLIVGSAVSLHPLVVALTVTSGLILGGLVGAFLAVPIVASVASIGQFYRQRTGTP